MDREVHVHADLNGTARLVGRMFARVRGRGETATFEYDATWLENDERYALEPALRLGPGPFQAGADKPLFGSIGDSAPDRWGRMLMRRAERRRAAVAGTAPRTLFEIDYLLEVSDEARQGALRFADRPGGPFLAQTGTPAPPLVDLPRLLSAAERIANENEDDEDLRLLMAPGSSLGGARPKASVREPGGRLAIAKFPHKDDEWNAVLWEGLSLSLANKAGINVSRWRPEKIADALRRHGARPAEDLRELWRRIVFNVLTSNVDDHMRNHGFLYTGTAGWTLCPAYDLNPTPVDVKPRVMSTAIDEEDQTASLELALSVAPYFDIDEEEAQAIACEVGNVVACWREEAAALGIGDAECERMESAFIHADLELACSFRRAMA